MTGDDWWKDPEPPPLPDWHVDIEFVVAARDEQNAFDIVVDRLAVMELRWEPHEVFPAV